MQTYFAIFASYLASIVKLFYVHKYLVNDTCPTFFSPFFLSLYKNHKQRKILSLSAFCVPQNDSKVEMLLYIFFIKMTPLVL